MCGRERILDDLEMGFIFPGDIVGGKEKRSFHPKLLNRVNFNLVASDGFERMMYGEEDPPPEKMSYEKSEKYFLKDLLKVLKFSF
ncbi:hypothetical protein ISS85_01675 [Candidatus Microgenomates bacterium]|nr:hypothetical protein [Candidatus Microgenomates bacterium]